MSEVNEGLAQVGWRRWLVLVVLVGLLLAYALALQGARGLWDPDEGRYTAVALEMLASGDWLTPRLPPDLPHFTKPPLTYWAIAATLDLCGRSELAARLPNTIAFVATVLLVIGIARNLGERRPLLAGSVYATLLMPYAAANAVTTDTLLTVFEALAGWGFTCLLVAPSDRHRRRAALVMWLGFSLAFLTKGPVGLLPLVAFVVVLAATGERRVLPRLVTVPSLAVFLVVGFGWFVVVVISNPGLLDYFLGYEVLDRLVSSSHGRNPHWYQALTVYGPALALGALPWSLLAIPGRRSLLALLSRRRWRERCEHDRALLLLLTWVVLPLVVFMLARSRLPLYVLPLFVPAALLLARLAARQLADQRWLVVAVAVAAISLVGLRLAAARLDHDRDAARLAATIEALAPGPVEEVLFVDEPSAFGIAFYLDCEVEHVALTADELRTYRRETIVQEYSEHQPDRVIVVDSRRRDALVAELRALGREPRLLGFRGRWSLLWDPAAPVSSAPSG